jgi:peptidoglycan hydrolase-like protein with peptidoglycan-binding domain
MNTRILASVGAALLIASGALTANEFTSLHPEEAIPDEKRKVSADPYTDFIKQVQESLHRQGFDAGPLNGDFGTKTQAALVQFQLSWMLPAGGQLDDQTLAALGVQRDVQASAGASAEPSAGASGEAPAGAMSQATAGQQPAPASPSPERSAEPKPPQSEHKPEPETGTR